MRNTHATDRRRFLKAAGLGVLGTSVLGSLLARAQSGTPKRFLLAMRPHGSVASNFFPQGGSATNFQLPSITSPFEPLKADMVFLDNLTNPRREGWRGEHDAGLFGMTTGREGDPAGEGATGTGISIDQLLAQSSPLAAGTLKRSIQLAGSVESAASAWQGPGLRILSYAGGGSTGALDPETRPDAALSSLFGNFVAPSAMPSDQAAQQRARDLQRAVLNQLTQDATRLKARVPLSEQGKLDEQLSAIADLVRQNETVLGGSGGGAGCSQPALGALAAGPLEHESRSRQMFQVLKGAFSCDLTRVASFSFAPEQSSLAFNRIIPNEVKNADGHHDVSHTADPNERGAIDRWYCSLLAELLLDMKNTPDGAGTSLLDNTVVAFITAIDDGNGHGMDRMPVLMFGGKSLGMMGGRIVDVGGRTMNDVWTSVSQAFGVQGNFGDPALVTGPVNGLFA